MFQPARLKRHNFLSPSLTVAMIYLAVVVVLCVCVFLPVCPLQQVNGRTEGSCQFDCVLFVCLLNYEGNSQESQGWEWSALEGSRLYFDKRLFTCRASPRTNKTTEWRGERVWINKKIRVLDENSDLNSDYAPFFGNVRSNRTLQLRKRVLRYTATSAEGVCSLLLLSCCCHSSFFTTTTT